MILAYAVPWIPRIWGGERLFAVPLSSQCQHCASLSSSFCRLSEKFFGTLARHDALPAWDGYHPSASPLWQILAGMASPFFKLFQIFIFNYFRYLQSLLKSSMILASYISFFVLNCNTCMCVCAGMRRKQTICLKIGQNRP